MLKNIYYKITLLFMCIAIAFSVTACNVTGGTTPQKSTPEQIVEEIQRECTMPEMKEVSEDQLSSLYSIRKEDVAYFSALVATDSLSKDEVIVIEAMDEGEACTIRDRLQEHYDAVLEESKEYLPDEYTIVEKCSVVKDGIYVRLFISEDADKMNEIYNSYM